MFLVPHTLQRDDFPVLSIPYLIQLVCILFLRTTYQSLSTSFFSHSSPCVVFILLFHFYSKLSMYSFFSPFTCYLFYYSFLELLRVNCFLVSSSSTFLVSSSNGSISFLMYQPRPFSFFFTLFSHPQSLLPPFLLL